MLINDLVSIIIPMHNSSKYIAKTIESIEEQTYKNYEAIFIDDCSKDNTVKIVEEYQKKNPKIKLIKLKSHKGVSEARNEGLRIAKGQFLTFLDSDDIWLEEKLEKQIKFIKQNNYEFVYCNFKYMSDDGKFVSEEIKAGEITDYNRALQDMRILTITMMIDLTKIPKELCYMPNVMNEDVATWWKILKKGYIAHGQDEVLAYYRQTTNSRSSKKYITAYYRWKLYREHEKLSFCKSIYCFTKYAVNAIKKRNVRMEKLKSNEQNEKLQIVISTQNLKNDEETNQLINKMNIKTDYLIVNQTMNKDVNISNKNVITKFEKGLSKSRNVAINSANGDILLLADDDVIYNNNYEEIIISAYEEYKNADIICFFVESKNKKRVVKRMNTGKIGYLKAMKIVSFEISFRKKSILENNLKFNENFGAGTKLNRGEEQIFLYEALRKGLNIIFVNKKIADVEQGESTWFTKYNEEFFEIQGKVFKQMTSEFHKLLSLQYAIRKYALYRKEIGFFKALKAMLKTK